MRPGERVRATYEFEPLDHLYRTEFYIWPEALERWKKEGLAEDWQERNLFGYDPQGRFGTGVNLGWDEIPFVPVFETEVVDADDSYEVVRDQSGRLVKHFRNRRHGFMPEYISHPVSNASDWEKLAARLDARNEQRWKGLAVTVKVQGSEADEALAAYEEAAGYMHENLDPIMIGLRGRGSFRSRRVFARTH